MALPASGEISTFAVFNEIRRRNPNVGEQFTMQNLFNWSVKNDAPEYNIRSFLSYDHRPLLSIADVQVEEVSNDTFNISISIQMRTPYYPSGQILWRRQVGEGLFLNGNTNYNVDQGSIVLITFLITSPGGNSVTFELIDNSMYDLSSPTTVTFPLV